MKRVRKAVAVLVALIMLFAISMPVMAHDATGHGPGGTTIEIFRAYHWVVRGDTLASIAAAWNTTPEIIVYNNWNYFHDLRLRNITYGFVAPLPAYAPWYQRLEPYHTTREGRWTYGVPILLASSPGCCDSPLRLEPGVRLYIGDFMQVRYYVRRGDTIESIIDGTSIGASRLAVLCPVRGTYRSLGPTVDSVLGLVNGVQQRIITTEANLIIENFGWFVDVELVNMTLNLNHSLLESQELASVYPVTHVCPVTGTVTTYHTPYLPSTIAPFGAPLYITLPVRAFMCPLPEIAPGCAYQLVPHRYSHLVYLRGTPNPTRNVEVIPWVAFDAHLQFNSFNPPPTNDYIGGVPLGLSQFILFDGPITAVVAPHFQVRRLPGGTIIPGLGWLLR